MRIGFAVDRFSEDVGMANVVFNLAKQLSDEDSVTVITFEQPLSESLKEKCSELGIEIETLERSSLIGFYTSIRKKASKIDDLNLDVISIHGFMAANAAAVSNTPVVKTNHAHALIMEEWKRNPVRLPLWLFEELPSVLKSDKTVSISKYARRQYRKIYRQNSQVIYNGIDLEDYRPITEEENCFREQQSENKLILGTLCMLRDYKNIKLALKALEDIDIDYHYFIGGKGPQKEELERIADEKDLNVTFLGFVDEEDIADFYSMLDLFLFPSKWEGFGVPVLEALACNTPVAALDQKGPKEIITEDTGYLLEEDEETWRETIEKSNKDRFVDNPRKRAREFSWEKAAEKYKQKMKEVI